ncbi:MAG TPA: Cj0069 family protein [Acidimicrobiales bacterium]|nr:Cj0069 family protein [Acidimicrobiales bacterium]
MSATPLEREAGTSPRVAVVWRGDADAQRLGIASNERLRPILAALENLGATAEPIVYREADAHAIRRSLSHCDGVLVWVDPIGSDGETRQGLDRILREVASHGIWVSAHPDVIAAIGTKDVLYRTRQLGWGCDTHRYADVATFRNQFPSRLFNDGPRVLKQQRGNGGRGVWKVEVLHRSPTDVSVSVHHAQPRDTTTEQLTLHAFMNRCEAYFGHGDVLIDQPFQSRVFEGLIRVYLVAHQVIGFALQGAGDLLTQPGAAQHIMGLPSPKTMFPEDHKPFQALRQLVETEWVPAMRRIVDIPTDRLPVLWDADFLLGPKTPDGNDTYVLCEINASCVTPFPPEAPAKIASVALQRIARRRYS